MTALRLTMVQHAERLDSRMKAEAEVRVFLVA